MKADLSKKIFVAGHQGMVGFAIVRQLKILGYHNIITQERGKLDLLSQDAVLRFFQATKIDEIYIAAAKVGGIHANNTYPADFIYQNLMIQTNIIHAAHCSQVERLLFLGSSCIYPKHAEQPMQETALLTGPVETTNAPYAIAKIAGIKMCEAYNRQFDRDYRSVMPTNLYGPGDNYHPDNSHVIPGLIARFHKAAMQQETEVVVWGSGTPKREFLHVNDLASACVHIMQLDRLVWKANRDPMCSHINIGFGSEITIADLAKLIAAAAGYKGQIKFDTSKPDGAQHKLVDSTIMLKFGWQASWSLEEGIKDTYKAFKRQLKDEYRM